jgi:hypothetical protein
MVIFYCFLQNEVSATEQLSETPEEIATTRPKDLGVSRLYNPKDLIWNNSPYHTSLCAASPSLGDFGCYIKYSFTSKNGTQEIYLADDFIVPPDTTWVIYEILVHGYWYSPGVSTGCTTSPADTMTAFPNATSLTVTVYDSVGNTPAGVIASTTASQPAGEYFTDADVISSPTLAFAFNPPLNLTTLGSSSSKKYWVSFSVNYDELDATAVPPGGDCAYRTAFWRVYVHWRVQGMSSMYINHDTGVFPTANTWTNVTSAGYNADVWFNMYGTLNPTPNPDTGSSVGLIQFSLFAWILRFLSKVF